MGEDSRVIFAGAWLVRECEFETAVRWDGLGTVIGVGRCLVGQWNGHILVTAKANP